EPRLAGLRLLADPLEPALDMIAICDEELELQRLEIVTRRPGTRESVQHDEQSIDLTQISEQRRTCPAHLDDANRRRRHLSSVDDLCDTGQPFVRNRGHADVTRCT